MKRKRFRRISRRHVRRSRTYILRTNGNGGFLTKRLIKYSAFLIFFCALAYGVIKGWDVAQEYISKTEILKINTIEFYGSKNILKGEILALLPFEVGDNILSHNLYRVEKEILKLKSELKKVVIKRGFKKIIIEIEERVPVGIVTLNGKKFGIDYDNIPFPLRGDFVKASLPEISARNDFDREEILQFVKIFADKANDYFSKSVLFYFESVEDAAVKLNDGTRIIWGRIEKDKFDLKFKKLNEVLEDALNRFKKIEYINLNYLDAGRVLVKPKMIFRKQNTTAGISQSKISLKAIR